MITATKIKVWLFNGITLEFAVAVVALGYITFRYANAHLFHLF